MDEGTLGEIRGFTGNFAPRYWAFCEGQTMAVAQNQALYSIISNIYGGTAPTNFMLPDLRGRAPIGVGQGIGMLEVWNLGEKGGSEYTTLAINNMPSHSHSATTSTMTVTGTASGNITPSCLNDTGGLSSPGGNVMGNASGAYSNPADADATMAPISASLTLNGTVTGTVAIGTSGNSAPFSNIQPSLVIHWIICLQGIYPMRD